MSKVVLFIIIMLETWHVFLTFVVFFVGFVLRIAKEEPFMAKCSVDLAVMYSSCM
jgi:hypothetical protein